MDKATHRKRVQSRNAKQLGEIALYVVAIVVTFWWSYALVSASDCGLNGVKLAFFLLPLCVSFGPIAAAAIPLGFGLSATWLLWRSVRNSSQFRSVTGKVGRPVASPGPSPNPSVKGTSRKRAAPYVER
jgi:hypothetical protein